MSKGDKQKGIHHHMSWCEDEQESNYQHKDVSQLLSPRVHISHCAAMDEAHEMKINKGTKQLVVRPTEENMHSLFSMMHYQSKLEQTVEVSLLTLSLLWVSVASLWTLLPPVPHFSPGVNCACHCRLSFACHCRLPFACHCRLPFACHCHLPFACHAISFCLRIYCWPDGE